MNPKTFSIDSLDMEIAAYKRELADVKNRLSELCRASVDDESIENPWTTISRLERKLADAERERRMDAIELRYEQDDAGAYINPSHRGLCLIIAAAHLLDMADPKGIGVGLLVEDMVAKHGKPVPEFDAQCAWLRHWGFKRIVFTKGFGDRAGRRTADDIYAEYGNCILESRTHVSAVVDGVLKGSYDDRVTATGRPRRFLGVFVPE